MNTIQPASVPAPTDKPDARLKKLREDLELLMKAKAIKARVAGGEEKTILHDELKQLMLEKGLAESAL